jgi:shikimate dehydrogenase
MKIILTGFMGAGKTTVARFLAKKTKFSPLEIDDEIVKKSGESSVFKIFEKHGESRFRELELQICQELEDTSKIIISTGGGIGIDEEKMNFLIQNTGIVFFLKTKFDTIKQRIGNDANRPLFRDEKKVQKLFAEREKKYSKFADFEISTDKKSPELIADEIFQKIEKLKVCLVIGDPIRHSLSPTFHNSAFKATSIPNFVFKTQKLKNENLDLFFKNIPPNTQGISVTIPHKVNVLQFCDEVPSSVQKIGACNTIFFKNNKICAENTDSNGVTFPILKRVPDLKNKKIAILGAGGVARAAIYEMKNLGAIISIFSRNLGSAKKLANEFNTHFGLLSELEKIKKNEIIINATPCGMAGKLKQTSAVPDTVFHKNQIVFDLVYTPVQTKFLLDAEKKGAKTISGIEMFVHQAAQQFKIYTKKSLSLDFCEKFIQKLIKKNSPKFKN